MATPFYLDAATAGLPATAKTSYDPTSPDGHATFTLTVDRDTAFVGYPHLRLYAEAEGADDMDIFVLLQKLDADGTALEQITAPNTGPHMQAMTRQGASILCYKGANGRLRASMRHLDAEKSTADVPVHAFDRVEKRWPGLIVALDIDLFPTGLLLYPGQQLLLTIGGWNSLGGAMPDTKNLVPDNHGRHIVHTGSDHASLLRIGTMPFAAGIAWPPDGRPVALGRSIALR